MQMLGNTLYHGYFWGRMSCADERCLPSYVTEEITVSCS